MRELALVALEVESLGGVVEMPNAGETEHAAALALEAR